MRIRAMNLFPLLITAVTAFQGSLPDAIRPKSPAPEKVVATVNGVEIHASDILPLLWDWRGQEVTQDVITFQLLVGEAKKANIVVPTEEIDKKFAERLEEMKQKAPPGTDVESALRQQGFPKSRLYLRVHTEMLVDRLALLDFRPENYFKVAIAVYQTNPKKPDLTAPATRAKAAYDQLTKGAAWMAVVRGSDLDASRKASAGSIGWRGYDLFPEANRTEIRGLKSNQFSKPFSVEGAHIILRAEKLGTQATPAELDEIRKQFLDQNRTTVMQRIQSAAKIERAN